jgi:hypothetical protein
MEQWKESQVIHLDDKNYGRYMAYCHQTKMLASADNNYKSDDPNYNNRRENITIWKWKNDTLSKLNPIEKLNPIKDVFAPKFHFSYNGENLIIFSQGRHFIAIYNFANDTLKFPDLRNFSTITDDCGIFVKPHPLHETIIYCC